MWTLSRNISMSTEANAWRELGQQLAESSSFDRLLEQEEEMESKIFQSVLTDARPSTAGNPEIKWLQSALNRVSAFGIAEDGVLSVQTRRALQKFQADQGLRPTGTMSPKTRTALIELSGIPVPRPLVGDDGDAPLAEMEAPSDRCPVDSPTVIRGFSRYSDDIKLLPNDQQKKLADIAVQISNGAISLPEL